MSLIEKITNFFKPDAKIFYIGGTKPEEVIPVNALMALPCSPPMRLTRACICMTCNFVSKGCPMEIACRNAGCNGAFIRSCTNYTNQEDRYFEEKRRIFKDGAAFDGNIFRFDPKSKENSRI